EDDPPTCDQAVTRILPFNSLVWMNDNEDNSKKRVKFVPGSSNIEIKVDELDAPDISRIGLLHPRQVSTVARPRPPSIQDPALLFVSHDDPAADSKDHTIGVPATYNNQFRLRVAGLAKGRHYKRLHLNFTVSDSWYRKKILKEMTNIKAETMTTDNTWMTKDDFPDLFRNKSRVIIEKELRSMHSKSYLAVIKDIFLGKIDLKYLESPIQQPGARFYLCSDIKNDKMLAELWKSDGCGGIRIDEGKFQLRLQKTLSHWYSPGHLTVKILE
ncbi:hypothetical protein PENTCL1PPCAC_22273, partial [Pristionchus entomophagus]